MRWSIVRVIWVRELRDQLRDRRTIFMIVLLPVFIYPLGGLILMYLAAGFLHQPRTVGVVGAENLPSGSVRSSDTPAAVDAARLLMAPPSDPASLATNLALAHYDRKAPPLLVVGNATQGKFSANLFESPHDADAMPIRFYPLDKSKPFSLDTVDRTPLEQREVDLLVVVPPDFHERSLEERPPIYLLSRPGDDRSRLVNGRVSGVLTHWGEQLKVARFDRHGKPEDFDHPLEIRDANQDKTSGKLAAENLYGLLIKVFPFVLMLWALVVALYPAIDVCAGEKERGTMETLLITPASREEIVWGKFLAIWVFSTVTSLVNLASMGITTWQIGNKFAYNPLQPLAFLWCVVLLLPLAAFFSALCLAVGAYARSTKEGQYYLMPLFLITLPLSLLTLAPGVQLNAFFSMVPITGVGLLLQKLLATDTPDPSLGLYFVTVLGPMLLYSWLALRWAIYQFNREEVLFREAERIEIGLWFRRLLREKETRPSAGQALFCFGLMLLSRWWTLGMGPSWLVASLITTLAFVAAPPLIMAGTLTTQPRPSLGVRLPPLWAWGVTLALAVLIIPPLLETVHLSMQYSPALREMFEENKESKGFVALLVVAWLPAVCEELAFRGFILTGLQRRFRPRTAVLLTSLLFALLQMNVLRFVPMFLFGMVLAYLTTRCGSVFPAILLHALYNTLRFTPAVFPETASLFELSEAERWLIVGLTGIPGAALLWWLTRLQPHPAYVDFLQSDPGLVPEKQGTP